MYYSDVSALLPSSCQDKKDLFKTKLASLAHEYANIKQDRGMFPLGKKHLEAIR